MIALGKMRGVYGIRKIVVSEHEKTIRVEFDFTRLNRDVVAELLRSAGIDIVAEIPLAAPPAPKVEPAAPVAAESFRYANSASPDPQQARLGPGGLNPISV